MRTHRAVVRSLLAAAITAAIAVGAGAVALGGA